MGYKDSTLFYIFYSCVNDKLQVLAARELYKRQWAYHKALKLWLYGLATKLAPDSIQFFDVEAWKRKHFVKRFLPHASDHKEKLRFWEQQKKRLLTEHQLDLALKACAEE